MHGTTTQPTLPLEEGDTCMVLPLFLQTNLTCDCLQVASECVYLIVQETVPDLKWCKELSCCDVDKREVYHLP